MNNKLTAVCVAAASLLTAGAVAGTVTFVSRYGYLWGYEDSLETLKAQEAELTAQLAEEETALKEAQAAYDAMAAAREADTWEHHIRQAFAAGEEAKAEADMVMLSALDQVSVVTFGTEDFNETMKEALLDEVVGAASDKIPLDYIITGVTEGVSEGLYGYAQSKAKDYVSDVLGGDIFQVAGIVDQLVNANSVPAVLANQMAEKQRTRAAGLVEFIGMEKHSVQDQRRSADSLYQLMDMEEQIGAATGRGTTLQKAQIYEQAVEYARQYGASQYAISQMARWKEETHEN